MRDLVVLLRLQLPRWYRGFSQGREKLGAGSVGSASPSAGGEHLPSFLPFCPLQGIKTVHILCNELICPLAIHLSAALRAFRLVSASATVSGLLVLAFEQLERPYTPRSSCRSCRTDLPIATVLMPKPREQATTVLPRWPCLQGPVLSPTCFEPRGRYLQLGLASLLLPSSSNPAPRPDRWQPGCWAVQIPPCRSKLNTVATPLTKTRGPS